MPPLIGPAICPPIFKRPLFLSSVLLLTTLRTSKVIVTAIFLEQFFLVDPRGEGWRVRGEGWGVRGEDVNKCNK